MSTMIEKVSKISTFDQLKKDFDLETIKSSLNSYFRNKEYHHKRNVKISEMLKRAKELGL